jgi:hypothetical protein
MKSHSLGSHICPCCGYKGLEYRPYNKLESLPVPTDLSPPYAKHFGDPSYEVCPCCGFEFGNDDEPGTAPPASFEEFLAEWVQDGKKWFDESRRQPGWNLEAQLREAGIKPPALP